MSQPTAEGPGGGREGGVGRPAAQPVSDAALRASFRHCHAVTRRRARNFYYGLKLTPQPKRSALYAIYAFMRACDDLADGDGAEQQPVREQLAQLEGFRQTMMDAAEWAEGERFPEGRIWPAFHHVVHRYQLNMRHLHAMLDGQRDDVMRREYETFDELYDYCYKVASTVGLVCLSIWGHDGDPQAKKLAEYRGVAFQLTNILRDLTEDAARGRIYLPQEDLERFRYTRQNLVEREANPAFERLMMYQIERARSYYDMSSPLDRHIAPECRATSQALTQTYRRLLERIAREPRQVLRGRVSLGRRQKMGIALRAMWRRVRGG
ncbi:MAG: phytoene/squalene synthase family protein [Phycisphaeraceae bacterium]